MISDDDYISKLRADLAYQREEVEDLRARLQSAEQERDKLRAAAQSACDDIAGVAYACVRPDTGRAATKVCLEGIIDRLESALRDGGSDG